MCSGDVAFRGLACVGLALHNQKDRVFDKECGIVNDVEWALVMTNFWVIRTEGNTREGEDKDVFLRSDRGD
jgi:hypothetical protein